MTVFITGSSGFVGLALTEHLLARGDTVIGFDRHPPRESACRAFAALPGRFVPLTGDVRDADALEAAMRAHRPSRLVTLAAITADAQRERAMPQTIFEVNVGGVLAALHAASRSGGIGRVVHISSGSVYGESGRDHARRLVEEITPLAPEGLYGISKRAAEDAARRIAGLYGLPLTIGRLGTCFGPWEADSGVRDTLSAPLQVLECTRRGDTAILPRAHRRDWLYVRDAAAAIVALLDTPALAHDLYNLAAGFAWSVVDWCERLAARDPRIAWRIASPDDTPNIDYYAPYDRAPMDIARLVADTPFVPHFDLAHAEADFHRWLDTPT
ncbi:NAD-dependent epimerase/dehydratase family protein [Paraburkholderia sp. ZP32-5]|uniref:NAD-dependent epimerase/dehydratase family protein n=1 Tax=Paraburkholderia sp. ZP32-5 TaxID=2883245 RepID=UPI001F3034AE|nr:NAD(P)-dependent oxidoreductase [Paraburkholderia sp. ZP32-5]